MITLHHSCSHTSQYAALLSPREQARRESHPCHACELAIAQEAIRHALEPLRLTEQEAALYDEAVERARALGRPFEEHEVFGFIWEQGIELVPQCDPYQRFTLYQEATSTTRRLWALK